MNELILASGELRQHVSIMSPSVGADAHGDVLPGAVFATRWASVDTMNGQEVYQAQQFATEANVLVTARYLSGVTPQMTVQYGTRSMEILYVRDVKEQHVVLKLYCKEIS